jgi:hypothetical protein
VSIADLIRKRTNGKPATANPAISATQPEGKPASLARIATIAVANLPEAANSTPADERLERVLGRLHGDAGLRYAVEVHDGIEPEAVILTVAIRGKAACELRIPKSRYDAFALMELIEQHTTRETLQ